MSATYQERPRKGGGNEAFVACRSCQGTGKFRLGTTGNNMTISELCFACKRTGGSWRKLVPCAMTASNAQKVHAGTKTQTRRLAPDAGTWNSGDVEGGGLVRRPRYRVGDVLWVQEPWRTLQCDDLVKPTLLDSISAHVQIHYEGTGKPHDFGKLRPGRFLPLRFARPHRYEVTAVRLERVNEISEADALAEGMTDGMPCGFLDDEAERPMMVCSSRCRFKGLWDSIHDAPGTRFADAPWVFAYTFKQVQP